jgi:membrane protein
MSHNADAEGGAMDKNAVTKSGTSSTGAPAPTLARAFGAALIGFTLWRTYGESPTRPVRRQEPEKGRPAKPAGRAGEGKGRAADGPTQIPAGGWKSILVRTYNEIGNDRAVAVAAGVTFYALLAIFPALGAFVSLYGLVADPATLSEHLNIISGVLPGGGVDIISEQLTRLTSQPDSALGFGFIFGLGVALWSANAGVKALFDALNVAYGEREKRGFIALNVLSLTFTAGAIVLMIVGLIAIAVVPIALDYFGLKGATEGLLAILRWPLLFVISGFAISLLYRYGPSRERAKWRWVTLGGFVAAALWMVASLGFSYYVSNFGSYNETYGSLGAAIGFMTWMWISTVILLAGAELNAETEHQTEKDSTTGAPQPIGAMADEVASH